MSRKRIKPNLSAWQEHAQRQQIQEVLEVGMGRIRSRVRRAFLAGVLFGLAVAASAAAAVFAQI